MTELKGYSIYVKNSEGGLDSINKPIFINQDGAYFVPGSGALVPVANVKNFFGVYHSYPAAWADFYPLSKKPALTVIK